MQININLIPTEDGNYHGCLMPTHEHKFLNPETGEVLKGKNLFIFEANSPFDAFKQLIGWSNTIKEIDVNNENS